MPNKIKVIVLGTKGRMAVLLAKAVNNAQDMELIGQNEPPTVELFATADAVIDFTHPDVSLQNTLLAAQANTCVVLGTTGFNKAQMQMIEKAGIHAPILQSGNTSIGANVVIELVKQAAMMLGAEFNPHIIDIHHKDKVDKPSGTAIMLGDAIDSNRAGKVKIHSIREGDSVGEHGIMFKSGRETVGISHEALDRAIFAEGALRAVRWLIEQPAGFYGMSHMLAQKTPPKPTQVRGKPQ